MRDVKPKSFWGCALAITLVCKGIAFGATNLIVVTTSLLDEAAKGVGLNSNTWAVQRIIPPGSCPGHFDLPPSILPAIRDARLFICHDFQQAVARRISQLHGGTNRIVVMETGGSYLIPTNFEALRGRMADVLKLTVGDEVADSPTHPGPDYELSETLQMRAAPWRGTPVIASKMQQEFCEWLGLDVVAVLPRPEEISPRDMVALRSTDAAFIVGNFQSDGNATRQLGVEMNLPAAVLSNFPDVPGYGKSYRDLVLENVDRLEEAWRKHR